MMNESLAPAHLPPGVRAYAVGDVHGCDDRLAALHRLIAADARQRPGPDCLLIHLGDYIDRGPQSAAVIARLAADPIPGMACVNLAGNHEQMMLAALGRLPPLLDDGLANDPVGQWLGNGGAATLRSWGLSPSAPPATWRAGLPAAHLDFLRSLQLRHQVGPYLFVHAGLRPGVPLAAQDAHDQLWIREPFLHWPTDLQVGVPGLVAVHGHTPNPLPEVRAHRIGIDTGAVAGGPLTCLVLEANTLRFLAVAA